jgi:hypothetical protein
MDDLQITQIISFSEMKRLYPDQWVLVGDPELENPEVNGSITSKLVGGVFLYASKDKREIAYKAADLRRNVTTTVCIFTGEWPKSVYFFYKNFPRKTIF